MIEARVPPPRIVPPLDVVDQRALVTSGAVVIG
jgi:hypothetical protein